MNNKRLLFLVGVTAISAIIATSILLNTPERFSANNEKPAMLTETAFLSAVMHYDAGSSNCDA